MRTLTEKDIQQLKDAKDYFEQVKRGYIRSTPTTLNKKVEAIYEEVTGKKQNIHCGQCLYTLYKEMGKIYEKAIEDIKKEQEITAELTEPVLIPEKQSKTIDSEKSKKKGRPKKATKK